MLYIASYILIIICFTRYKPNTINLIGKIKSLELEIIKIFEISTIQISIPQNFVESKGPLNFTILLTLIPIYSVIQLIPLFKYPQHK